MLPSTVYSRFTSAAVCFFAFAAISVSPGFSQNGESGKTVYDQIKSFALTGGKAEVSNLSLKRDRVQMTFTGTFYFTAPVNGKVVGAVFVGQGTFRAGVPESKFETDNLKRLLKAEFISTGFTSAVLRFTDDTLDIIGKEKTEGGPSVEAQRLAAESNELSLKQSGMNIASRLTTSLLNNESPGFFMGSFDGSKYDRFNLIIDHQNRIPNDVFSINAGEKGLIYSYKHAIKGDEVWAAFYSEADYARRQVAYSDANDIVDIDHFKMDLDVRNPNSKLAMRTRVLMRSRSAGVRSIPFSLGESLGESGDERLKKQLRLKTVRLGNETIEGVQEDWEGGLTVFLPQALAAGQAIEIEFEFEGDFLQAPPNLTNCWYPRSTTSWYPRHGYLDRAKYDLRFVHSKKSRIATVGTRTGEGPMPESKDEMVTTYEIKEPVALVTFAIGPWERHMDSIKWDKGEAEIPLEFNSMPGSYLPIKEDFILAELNNSVRYFHALFGAYPYATYSATFHPYGFGQGFPTMLMIPATDRASKYTYSFVSHETAHQWWGNIVAWRSYRDQWLSEGFAEYSGVMYTSLRESPKAARSLIDSMRESIKRPPLTTTGIGGGKLNDIGPIVMGHRLNTSRTLGSYQALIYDKGALVLRMLHFLFSDPSSNDDRLFFEMMKAFVANYRNSTASTEDFLAVANQHFAKTPISVKYRVTDLNWFFKQWLYETSLPSYRLEYTLTSNPDGTAVASGNLIQEGVDDTWFMPLPILFTFGGNRFASGTIHAIGPKTPFHIKLPAKPTKVELDPHRWVLSDKTETKGL
jgi:hypothetical protein